MEAPVDLSLSSLERCSYRYLQQTAKSMGLPSNVKKTCLIEMIHAKNYSSPEYFDSVVAKVKDQRKQASKPRKNAKKKKRVQGTEISSTSKHSPPLSVTPQPSYVPFTQSMSQTIKKYSTSILNPLITKRALNSDRVLRSYNNKLRKNMRYSFLDVNDAVVGVIKSKNTVSKSTVQERLCEWDAEEQRYKPVTTILKRRESIETEKFVVRQSRRDREQSCSQQLPQYDIPEERQLVPVLRNSIPVPRPQRRLSGIYPLKPAEQTQYQSSVVTYRQDGRICKLNTMVSQRRPINILKNKMTQTVPNNVKPIVVSLRNAMRPQTVAALRGSFSNSSTETAEDSSVDNNIPTVEQRKPSSVTNRNPTYILNRKPGPKCYTRLMQNTIQIRNKINLEKNQNTRKNAFDKVFVVEDHSEFAPEVARNRVEKMDFSVQNRQNFTNNVRTDVRRVITGVINERMRRNSGDLHAVENQNSQSGHVPYVTAGQNCRNTWDPLAVENQHRQINHDSLGQQTYQNSYVYATETESRYTQSQRQVFSNIEAQHNIVTYPTMQGNMDLNNTIQNMYREKQIRTSTGYVYSDQDCLTYPQAPANLERDYPNMYGLTDVMPENQLVSVPQAANTVGENQMAVYYSHIRLQAERRRGQGLVNCIYTRPSEPKLPHISELFRHLQEPRYRHLATPLYIDVGVESAGIAGEGVAQGKPLLEKVYNYSGPSLAAPLSRLHTVRTTTNTSTINCVSVVATPAPHLSAPVITQYTTDPYPRPSCQQYNVESEQLPRMHDYTRMAAQEQTDMTCDEVLQQSPQSRGRSVSARSSPLTAPVSTQIQDALDIISQDGDYMERISMEVGAQCFLCAWAGPSSVFDCHVRAHHAGNMFMSESPAWSHMIVLGRARAGVRLLTEHDGRIYVLNTLCRGTSFLHADITMIPKDTELEILPIYGRLTIYNKMTGEPFTWEGEIPPVTNDQPGSNRFNPDQIGANQFVPDQNRQSSRNVQSTRPHIEMNALNKEHIPDQHGSSEINRDQYESNTPKINQYGLNQDHQATGVNRVRTGANEFGQTRLNGLNVDLANLDLLPNSANLKLVNGEWVVKSSTKVVAGQPELDNIEICIYVQILGNNYF